MIQFLAGAVTMGYIIAALYFVRFWRKTSDPLFVTFAAAFLLFALSQLIVSVLSAGDERHNYAYILRVLGFTLILVAIIAKNVGGSGRSR